MGKHSRILDRFEQEQELAEKEHRLSELNSDLNIEGDGGLEFQGDMDSRDEASGPLEQALNNMGLEYRDISVENDEPDRRVSAVAHPKQKYKPAEKPSILETVRKFDSAKFNSNYTKEKQGEQHI